MKRYQVAGRYAVYKKTTIPVTYCVYILQLHIIGSPMGTYVCVCLQRYEETIKLHDIYHVLGVIDDFNYTKII